MSQSDSPLLVYLDSSDFSVMSDPKRGHEWKDVLDGLQRHVAQGDIKCVFSQAHLTEMAPVAGVHSELAVGKVDLLVSLCNGYALPSMDRLMSEELLALREGGRHKRDLLVSDGEWFPAIDGLFDLTGSERLREAMVEVVGELNQNRAQRRAAKKLVKNGEPSTKLLHKVRAEPAGDAMREIQRAYPMRDADARVLVQYMRGQAGRKEAHAAFAASLRDPRWLMRWLGLANVDVSKFNGWFREPSLKLKTVIDDLAILAKEIRALPPEVLAHVAPQTILAKREWDLLPDDVAGKLAQRLAQQLLPASSTPLPLERLHEVCAGLSVALRTFYSAAWASTTAQPRTPMASDLGDCYHAMYAPYVDLFRPDSFMAPHVERQTARFGTQVIPKLKLLLPAIDARLLERRGRPARAPHC